MFEKETVFILGAGASIPYGYPSGVELIKNIIEDMEDEIFVLMEFKGKSVLSSTIDYDENGDFNSESFEYDFEKFKHLQLFLDFDPNSFTTSGKAGNMYKCHDITGKTAVVYQTKIKTIKQFKELKKTLEEFAPISIDTFLRDNESHALYGHIMINYSLLKRENKENFKLGNAKTKHGDDNWYSYLLNDLLAGCADAPEKILKNKLNIVTFNYDLSLDYCLYDKLSQTEALKKDYGSKYLWETLLAKLLPRIKHVYGKLYTYEEIEEYGTFSSSNNVNANFRRFLKACREKDRIRTMYRDNLDNKEHYSEIHRIIEAAKEIIIIGFSFDRDNLDILGLPRNLEKWAECLAGKSLKYLDYKGKMGVLFSQFSNIENKSNINDSQRIHQGNLATSITRSVAEKITDAYQNDFKIYLY